VLGGLLVLVAAAYLGLCAWAGGQGVFPNVTVAGQDVSGMSSDEVRTVAQQALESAADEAAVTLHYGDWSGTLRAADLVPFEAYASNAALHAYWAGRDGFLTQGWEYLRRMMGAEESIPLQPCYWGVEQPFMNELLDGAQAALRSDQVETVYAAEGEALVMTKGRTHVTVDRGETAMAVFNALEQEVLPAIFRGEKPETALELTVSEVRTPVAPDFEAVRGEFYTEVAEPVYDKATGLVSDHVVGVDLDAKALKQAYEKAAEGEQFSIPLTITQPRDTRESYEAKLFADLLGQGTTNVTGTSNRKTNVTISAAACDGIVVMPGEEFSYNNTTGSRSEDKGYLPANIYVGGRTEEGVGGGTCQVSSTIYYAVLQSTLEIVERHDHKFATSYLPDGMDATVYFGSLDFRFKNNTDYPIKIETESYNSGSRRKLNVKIYGTNVDGRYGKAESTVFDVVEPTTKYVADQTVPQGTTKVDEEQTPYRGRKAQTYRYIYEKDGTLVETQNLGVSKYDMRPTTIYYNPLDGDPATWVDGKPPVPVVEPAPVPVPESAPAEQ